MTDGFSHVWKLLKKLLFDNRSVSVQVGPNALNEVDLKVHDGCFPSEFSQSLGGKRLSCRCWLLPAGLSNVMVCSQEKLFSFRMCSALLLSSPPAESSP